MAIQLAFKRENGVMGALCSLVCFVRRGLLRLGIGQYITRSIGVCRVVKLSPLIFLLAFSASPDATADTKAYQKNPAKNSSKSIDREMAHLTMEYITFHVPRKYIPFMRYEKDGETNGINLLFIFPDMKSEDESSNLPWKMLSTNSINGLIEPASNKKQCWAGECKGVIKMLYQSHIITPYQGPPGCLRDGVYNESLGLTSYFTDKDTKNEIEFFVRGNPCEPDHFMECDTKKSANYPGCKDYVVYKEKFLLSYTIRRELLDKHDEIRRKWLSKLDEFTQTPRTAR